LRAEESFRPSTKAGWRVSIPPVRRYMSVITTYSRDLALHDQDLTEEWPHHVRDPGLGEEEDKALKELP